MQLNATPKKNWLNLNIEDDSSDQETNNQKTKQQIKSQKIYDVPIEYNSYIMKQTTRDKFGVNRVQKGLFVDQKQLDQFQFNAYEVITKLHNDRKSIQDIQKVIQIKKTDSIQTPLNVTQSPTKSQQNRKQSFEDVSQKSNSPSMKIQSQKLISARGKMFHLDLSSSQQDLPDSDDSQQKKSEKSKQQYIKQQSQGQDESQSQNTQKSQQSQKIQQNQENQKQQKENQQEQSASQQQENKTILRKKNKNIIQLNEFKFDQESQLRVLQKIPSDQTVRAILIRSKSVLNVLGGFDYIVKIQNSGLTILNFKKQNFTFQNVYKIFSKTVLGKNRYFGKISSNFKATQYQIFISQDGVTEFLRAEIYFVSNTSNFGQPSYFLIFILEQPFNLQDLVTDDHNLKSLKDLYRFQQNRDKITLLHTRKPVFLKQIGGFVLNFNGRVNTASIKNFILEDYTSKKETLMFGKIGKDLFRLQISNPLNCVLGSAIVMVQFETRILQ